MPLERPKIIFYRAHRLYRKARYAYTINTVTSNGHKNRVTYVLIVLYIMILSV